MLVIHVFLENQWLQPDCQSGLVTMPWVPFASAVCDLSCRSSDYISQHDLFRWPWQKNNSQKYLPILAFFFMLSNKFVSALIFISELFRLILLFSGLLRHSLGHEIFIKKNFSNISQIWALSKGFHLCHFLDILHIKFIFSLTPKLIQRVFFWRGKTAAFPLSLFSYVRLLLHCF